MTHVMFIYTTAPDEPTADRLALAVVDARLAACVNILPGVRSTFLWKGAVEQSQEVSMIIKTTSDALEAAMEMLRDLHPYELPALSAFAADPSTDPATVGWILRETGAK